jgi:hypothetical protein
LLHGHIDTATSSGYVEGWAWDTDNPLRAVEIFVRSENEEVAAGLANRYRHDLMQSGCGTGWCAFRLKLKRPVADLAAHPLTLHEAASGGQLFRLHTVNVTDDTEEQLHTLDQVLESDPTRVYTIDALEGCASIMTSYLQSVGAEAFVRAAFIYMLARPAGPDAMADFLPRLRAQTLTPFELLKILYETEEFASGPRMIAAPPDPGFVFQAV